MIFRAGRTGFFRKVILLVALLWGCGSANANAARVADEEALKAAYLYNFAKFVEWPASFDGGEGPIELCIWSEDALDAPFAKIQGRSAQNREIHVKQFAALPESRLACHILFISQSPEHETVAEVMAALGDLPVLTVSDREDFVANGGMIEFKNVAQHIKFIVNIGASRTAGLTISAFLLQLALEVRDSGK